MTIKSKLDPIIYACQELLNYEIASDVKKYLDNRIPEELQKEFMCGYFPPIKDISVFSSYITIQDLFDCNLIYNKKVDEYSDRVILKSILEDHNMVMPYCDVYGNIIAIVGRTIVSEEERVERKLIKYKNTEFKKGYHLFGLDKAKHEVLKNNYIILVEGQIDCIRCFQCGYRNVAAIGSSNLTMEQAGLIKRFCDKIVLLLDNDLAGKMGKEKIMSQYKNQFEFIDYKLPDGYKDVDEYLKYGNSILI